MGHAVRRIDDDIEGGAAAERDGSMDVIPLRERDDDAVAHGFATVRAVENGTVTYESRRGQRDAPLAPSCLLQPEVGDRILVVEDSHESYVLEVVRRESDKPARVSVEGDLELAVGGRLRMVAKEGLDLVTQRAVRLLGHSFDLRAQEGEVAIERLAILGRELVASSRAAKFVSDACESVVGQLRQHVEYSYRTVVESDQLRAKRIDYRTQEEISMRAKHAFVHAADLVKVTGAQIHMG